MKVVLFGTPRFAAFILDFLLSSQVEVVAVVSRPDKSKGRSGSPAPTPIKEYLLAKGTSIPLYQPEKCSTPEFAAELKKYQAELFVVVAYGEIIKQEILDIPSHGCINIHASLLPKLRGAAPIQRSIINGDSITGITIMHMVKKMDAGDIIAQQEIPITSEMTFGELEREMMAVSGPLLLRVMKEIAENRASRTPQEEALVTFAPKIELEDCEIRWNKSSEEIHNLVRGVNPYPGAWMTIKVRGEPKRLKVIQSKIFHLSEGNYTPGEIIQNKNHFLIACGRGVLELLQVQLEGKKACPASEFLRGYGPTLSV